MGKKLIKDHQKLTELVIYKLGDDNKFSLEKIREFKFHDACMEFSFCVKNSNELLFFTKEELFKFNYLNDTERETVYVF